MSAPTPPADTQALLVPVHLDAWVVDSTNQEVVSWYPANYANLATLADPLPPPFATTGGASPATGVHLYWSLPDALTHGIQATADVDPVFPPVPNRWMVTRFSVPSGGAWTCDAAWVVQSDYLNVGGTGGTSPFLDPTTASQMVLTGQGASTMANITVNQASLGTSYTITAWEAQGDPGGQTFLQAVGPGNESFSGYVPNVSDVFSFVDTGMPAEGTGVYTFTYLVVGWYADPSAADPLRGVTTWDPSTWPNQADWQALTQAERFSVLMDALDWSVDGDPGDAPPSTSLYHGVVASVQWPYSTLGNAGLDAANVQVVVANTAADALAALIRTTAQQQAAGNPDSPWVQAASTLTQLLQAMQYGLLSSYGTGGGLAAVEDRVMQAWFGGDDGGTLWQAVSATVQAPGQTVQPPQLTADQTAALNTQLAALNQAQRALDTAQRELESLQGQLYRAWWKVGVATTMDVWTAPTTTPPWNDLKNCLLTSVYPGLVQDTWTAYCSVATAAAALPPPTDATAATAWADANWSFPASSGSGTVQLSALGLQLKPSALPRFWHPVDPVVLIAGLDRGQTHGEDGRYNDDDTLTCRLPGQTVTGIVIPNQPALDVAALQAGGVNLDPCPAWTAVPDASLLVQEAFFADPANAQAMSTATGIPVDAVTAAIQALTSESTTDDAWAGTAPAPFALAAWTQAWLPLFLEWEVQYWPTTETDSGGGQAFSIGDWSFDGTQWRWAGTGYQADYFSTYSGRSLLTPQAPLTFAAQLNTWLQQNPSANTPQMQQLVATVQGWDLLSQSLSGFTDQTVTLDSQATFPPPPCTDPVPCPPTSGDPPCITTLIGDQYHTIPVLQNSSTSAGGFYPVRGGFLQFTQLQAVDAFGQTYDLSQPNSTQGFVPILGPGMAPEASQMQSLPVGAAQLTPAAVQDGRLDLLFLANDGSGQDVAVSANPNAVCGWLLPNHLDGGISVYDADGILLGELVPPTLGDVWRPRPGPPGSTPPPATPQQIPNAALSSVVASIAAQSADVFGDFLSAIDETLWMVDTMGGRQDGMLSVLIGRPLAVVQAQLSLSLSGPPIVNQTWNEMVSDAACTPVAQRGEILDVAFPVRVGSLELRDDGVMGYWLPSESYGTFHTVHLPQQVSAGDTYLEAILDTSGATPVYQGGVELSWNGAATTLTLLLDPRGSVHAYTGIMPVATAALPGDVVDDLMAEMAVTFQTGPIVADPGTLRLPLPAEQGGSWSWIQKVAAPTDWEVDAIVDADDVARLPDGLLQLRDGWLQLSDPGTGG
jgi:hypothetical protein